MSRQSLALIDLFSSIPDFRQSKGKRHPLSAILSLAVAAILCGYKSYSAIAEWGRFYGQPLAASLGFTHAKTPCAATLHNVFRQIDKDLLEDRLASWAQSILRASADPTQLEGIAIDGKTLRGSRKQGCLEAHLLSAVSQRLGLTLFERGVEDKTNEIGVILELLKGLLLDGKVITVDALLTQREVAENITEEGGHYVMIVKDNQPHLRQVIEGAIEGIPFYREERQVAESLDSGHGRIEERKLIATSVLAGQDEVWPGISQVFRLERRVEEVKSGKKSYEMAYGVTSLCRDQASGEKLLGLVRQHWVIENKSHWVRDVVYGEDHSQVRKGSIPQVMAALRNAAIGLMRSAGEPCIASACRKFAAQPWQALALMGIHQKIE
jgi:predicted transposase YbfD/YdcC